MDNVVKLAEIKLFITNNQTINVGCLQEVKGNDSLNKNIPGLAQNTKNLNESYGDMIIYIKHGINYEHKEKSRP